jgi:hypothetical protein
MMIKLKKLLRDLNLKMSLDGFDKHEITEDSVVASSPTKK